MSIIDHRLYRAIDILLDQIHDNGIRPDNRIDLLIQSSRATSGDGLAASRAERARVFIDRFYTAFLPTLEPGRANALNDTGLSVMIELTRGDDGSLDDDIADIADRFSNLTLDLTKANIESLHRATVTALLVVLSASEVFADIEPLSDFPELTISERDDQ